MGIERRLCGTLSFIAAMAVSACGGGAGGGSGPVTQTPPPPPPPAPQAPAAAQLTAAAGLKQLRFNWTAVSGVTHYRLLANPDGASGFTQVGADIAAAETTATIDIAVHFQDWADARYVLDACNAVGCTPSNQVGVANVMLQSIGYFKPSNPGAVDVFGNILALSADGTTLAVASWQEDSNATGVNGNQADESASNSGAVYVFRRDATGTWAQQAYIKASNTEAIDRFGRDVALSTDGNTLAISADQEDSNATGINGNEANNTSLSAGAVYVFGRDEAGVWTQRAYLKASNTGGNDQFGCSVSLSANGNLLAVGAHGEASAAVGINGNQVSNATSGAGAVYIFVRDDDGAWTQEAYIKSSNTESIDFFGESVALSGDATTLAVGAINEDSSATGIGGNQADNAALDSGAVYVFRRAANGTWSQETYVKASNTQGLDHFGSAVALNNDGSTLIVGAVDEDSAATGIDGNQADNLAPDAGAVYVFRRDSNSAWTQQAYIKAPFSDPNDDFGNDVAVSADGNLIAVGSPGEASDALGVGEPSASNALGFSGAVHLFRFDSGAWTQRAYVKSAKIGQDAFGTAIGLSADANTLVVGALGEDGSAPGVNPDRNSPFLNNAGAVYMY
jgi:FG-GAP repeat